MIWFGNRTELFKDENAEAAANVWSVLKANYIEYEMRTLKSQSTLARNLQYRQAMRFSGGGMGGSAFAEEVKYVYVIYVRKKDLERAKELCDL